MNHEFNDLHRDNYRIITHENIVYSSPLNLVPCIEKTKELCILAILSWHINIKNVPEQFKKELFKLALYSENYNVKCYDTINYGSIFNMINIEYIPKEVITEEIFLKEILNNRYPDFERFKHIYTEDFIQRVLLLNPAFVSTIPQEIRKNYYKYISSIDALLVNIHCIQCIPVKYNTKQICDFAISKDINSISFIPYEFRTKELCELAISKNSKLIHAVPKYIRTKEFYKLALSYDSNIIQHIPEYLKTKEICELAISKNGYTLKYIPEHLKTEELCEIAMFNDSCALKYVPEHLKTEELCEIAILENMSTLKYIPDKFKKELKNKNNYNDQLHELKIKNKQLELKNACFELKLKNIHCDLELKDKQFNELYNKIILLDNSLKQHEIKNRKYNKLILLFVVLSYHIIYL